MPFDQTYGTLCENLKKPIVPVHKEIEKEIWAAYCDGLNALNRERSDFIDIDFVGKPILYNDTDRATYTP